MASSYTYSETATFTVTHARHMAAKVAADLKRMQRHYGKPTDIWIEKYEAEVVALLKAGYLGTASYGFKRDDKWIEPTLKYTARELAGSATNDDPGRVSAWANTSGADFHSYMTYSPAWNKLTWSEQETFKNALPFQRAGADEPGIDGYLIEDRTYSAGGKSLGRSSVKSY
jgi:hypothetical protein